MMCLACQRDEERDAARHARQPVYHREAREACRRVHRKSPQWWERAPGHAVRHVKSELAAQARRLN